MTRSPVRRVLATTLLGTVDTNAILPIIALYAAFRGADPVMGGIIVGLYSAVHAPANLLFGHIADRWGRTRPLRLGLLWDAVSVLLYAFAATPFALALVRVSHGVGGAFVGPSTMALAADASEPARRGRSMALYGMSIAIAVVVGTGIAGPVAARYGFEPLFFLLAALLLLGFIVSLGIREPATPPASWRLRATGLGAYVRKKGPAAGYAAIFGMYFVLGAFVALVPLHLRDALGYGPLEVGLSFFTFAAVSLIMHYPGGILSDRFGATRPALLGLIAVGSAMAAIPFARDVSGVLGLMVVFGMGHGLVFPSASALVTRFADPSQRGVVTGLFYSLLVAGVAVGAPAMAALGGRDVVIGISASAAFTLLGIGFVARAWSESDEQLSHRRANASASYGNSGEP